MRIFKLLAFWLAGLGWLAAVGVAGVAAGDWTPPIGIPAPGFGIVEVARTPPSPWTTATPGFYFVDQNHASATDSSNPYGTPSKPRRTIPGTEGNPLPAGSVVEVHGRYDFAHTSPNDFHAAGTAAAPIFVRGVSAAAKPIFTTGFEAINCHYVIFENLEFADRDGNLTGGSCGSFAVTDKNGHRYDSDHVVLRHCDFHGNLEGGGVGVGGYSATSVVSDVVIYGCGVHDNGDLVASFDQDVHGIAIGGNTHKVWVVDNTLARNSGDGLQINGTPLSDPGLLHHIYVGRNLAYHNKQSGLWTKTARDVIFSQNTSYGHRPSNSSMGAGMGFQYSPERVWFLFNHIYDCEYGIGSGSDKSPVYGQNVVILGNVIHNIHSSDGHSTTAGGWDDAAISLVGGTHRYVLHNTIYDVDGGIYSPTVGHYVIENNIIAQLTRPDGNHLFLEADWNLTLSVRNNIFFLGGAAARIKIGIATYTLPQAQSILSIGQACLTADPGMMNPAGNDFRLQNAGLAVDAGELSTDVYGAFEAWYPGQSIRFDGWGTARPQGATWDIGANELPASGVGALLALPATVTLASYSADAAPTGAACAVSFSGGTGTETWTAAAGAGGWFTIVGGAGTGTGSFSIQAKPGLAAGNYSGSVVVTAPGASNSPRAVAVALTVNSSGGAGGSGGSLADGRKRSGCAVAEQPTPDGWLWIGLCAAGLIWLRRRARVTFSVF